MSAFTVARGPVPRELPLALRVTRAESFTVARVPVPRELPFHRSAGACPPRTPRSPERWRGTGPRPTDCASACFPANVRVHRSAGACPPRMSRSPERWRGTGPRPTDCAGGSAFTVARGPVPREPFAAPSDGEGQALALRGCAGACPPRANVRVHRSAGDRPPRSSPRPTGYARTLFFLDSG